MRSHHAVDLGLHPVVHGRLVADEVVPVRDPEIGLVGAVTNRIGMWLDTASAYWTLSNDYIESVWWLFHELWIKGAIYEGNKVVPYCARCGTAV